MTKVDIVERIHNSLGITKNESAELLETVFAIMKNTLEQGENIKVSGFGNFEVKRKQDRRGRNPQTGKAITIAARSVLTFKPSAILKNCINQGKES